MIKKVIGISLLVIGVFVGAILLTYGGPVFPHLMGPIVFVITGGVLLAFDRIARYFRPTHAERPSTRLISSRPWRGRRTPPWTNRPLR